MGFFTKLGSTINGGDGDVAEEQPEDEASADEPAQTGPNFMPSKQKDLYLKAYANAADLSDTGVCSECGTTLSPFKAERLFASCKNEACENYLRQKEIESVKRYEDRHGVPEEVEVADEQQSSDADSEDKSALDGLSEAMDGGS